MLGCLAFNLVDVVVEASNQGHHFAFVPQVAQEEEEEREDEHATRQDVVVPVAKEWCFDH